MEATVADTTINAVTIVVEIEAATVVVAIKVIINVEATVITKVETGLHTRDNLKVNSRWCSNNLLEELLWTRGNQLNWDFLK